MLQYYENDMPNLITQRIDNWEREAWGERGGEVTSQECVRKFCSVFLEIFFIYFVGCLLFFYKLIYLVSLVDYWEGYCWEKNIWIIIKLSCIPINICDKWCKSSDINLNFNTGDGLWPKVIMSDARIDTLFDSNLTLSSLAKCHKNIKTACLLTHKMSDM